MAGMVDMIVLRKGMEHPSSKILVVDDGVENRELIALVLAEQVFGWKKQRTGSRRSTKLNAFDLVYGLQMWFYNYAHAQPTRCHDSDCC
jgi:CheY-like chemotaxis protein